VLESDIRLNRYLYKSGEQVTEQIWVNVTEGSEFTGYNREYIMKLAMKLKRQPENERPIKLRKRSNGWELWLPDLIAWRERPGHGPQRKRKETA